MEKLFKPPFNYEFREYGRRICDCLGNFCFQMDYDITPAQVKTLLEVINGLQAPCKPSLAFYDSSNGYVTVNGEKLILIRGWGYLTGTGGLNLPEEKAAEIQDELGNYIASQLTNR